MFGRLFDNALAAQPSLPFSSVKLETFKSYEGELPPIETLHEKFDGVLFSGSVSDIWEQEEKTWIKDLLVWIRKLVEWNMKVAPAEKRVRMLGSCFGHQVGT
jgi:GMP synthase-like glutamine amidotransferase